MQRNLARAAAGILLALGVTACGTAPETWNGETCGEPVTYAYQKAPARIGVAHVDGKYAGSQNDEHFMHLGARKIADMGHSIIKLYLTPDYAKHYPGDWSAQPTSLAELVQTRPFRDVLAMPFDTIVLTAYSFSLGTGDPWREVDDPNLLLAESAEFEELTRYLANAYRGTNKTFILQNWEGDWSVRASTDPRAPVTKQRAARMVNWLAARQEGVQRGRSCTTSEHATVLHAAEVNLVLGSEPGVADKVLPHVSLDLVSYSAWESLRWDRNATPTQQAQEIADNLTQAISHIRAQAAGSPPVYLGELGFAENEMNEEERASLRSKVKTVHNTMVDLDVQFGVYWQIFDNECDATGCRGFWLVKPDGTPSLAAQALSETTAL